jgi:hypothetical protein
MDRIDPGMDRGIERKMVRVIYREIDGGIYLWG